MGLRMCRYSFSTQLLSGKLTAKKRLNATCRLAHYPFLLIKRCANVIVRGFDDRFLTGVSRLGEEVLHQLNTARTCNNPNSKSFLLHSCLDCGLDYSSS